MPPQNNRPRSRPPAAGMPPQKPIVTAEKNSLAVAGFILAFLMPLLGLILSIIALKKSKNAADSNRSLAVAGIVISSMAIFFLIVIIVPLVLLGLQQNARDSARQDDIDFIHSALETHVSDDENDLPRNKAELDRIISVQDLDYYSETRTGLDVESVEDLTIHIVEQSDSVPHSQDRLPDIDTVHILIGVRCIAPGDIADGKYYTAGGGNVVKKGSARDFAILYAFVEEEEGEQEIVLCQDN